MKRFLLYLVSMILMTVACLGAVAEDNTVYIRLTDQKEVDPVNLHAGVRLGMTAEEVLELETKNKTKLYYYAVEKKENLATADNVHEMVSKTHLLYFKGKVGGVSGIEVHFFFTDSLVQDELILYRVSYELEGGKEAVNAYNKQHKTLIKNYGEPFASKDKGNVWAYYEVKPDYAGNRGVSALEEFNNWQQRLDDYAQWIIAYKGSSLGTGAILIEHRGNMGTNGVFYLKINYAMLTQEAIDAFNESRSAEDDEL